MGSASSTGSSSCRSPLRRATDLKQDTLKHPHLVPLRKLLQRRVTPEETAMQEVMLVVMLVEGTLVVVTVLEEMKLLQHKHAILKIDSILKLGREEDREDHCKSPLSPTFSVKTPIVE